jgi:Na+/proline symporter
VLEGWVVVLASFAYLGLLFAIAYYADRRADAGRSVIASPYIYSLSLAVYATAWTFYGSVGRAAQDGVGFLPIYIGPTLMIALWWIVMRKILRISKQNRITSLADFIASRYGKSALLGGVVTVIAVIGILPYISLQLKAISNSFTIVLQYPQIVMPAKLGTVPALQDTGFTVALVLAAFTILFGTRHLDAAEHHEGMVAAIAFESLVKLVAFLAVGAWVTWGLYNGFGDLFARAAADPAIRPMLNPLEGVAGGYASWVWLTILSMLAIMFLPRQFQVTVIENKDEAHLRKAIWLFPAVHAGHQRVRPADRFRRAAAFPRRRGRRRHLRADASDGTAAGAARAAVFIGGLSAATGMVIVETIALSTMVCNDLVMPVLLRWRALRLNERET